MPKTKSATGKKSFEVIMQKCLGLPSLVIAMVTADAKDLAAAIAILQKQLDANAPKAAPSGLAQLMAKYSKNGAGASVSADILHQQIEDASSLLRHLDAIAQAAETGNVLAAPTPTPVVTSVRADDRYETLIQAARLTTKTSTPAAVRDAVQKLAARLGGDPGWDLVYLLDKAAGAVDRPLHESGTYAMNHVRETMAKYAGIDERFLRPTDGSKAMSTKEIEERFAAFIDGELEILGDLAEALTGDRDADEKTIKAVLTKLKAGGEQATVVPHELVKAITGKDDSVTVDKLIEQADFHRQIAEEEG